jgi:hypothetical protein
MLGTTFAAGISGHFIFTSFSAKTNANKSSFNKVVGEKALYINIIHNCNGIN